VPFSKKIPRLVGRLGSGVWVSASFKNNSPPRGSVRVRTQLVGQIGSGQEYGLVPVLEIIYYFVGYLGSGPSIMGRTGSAVRACASLRNIHGLMVI